MPATRELSITYDATTIGGAIGPGTTLLTGWIRMQPGPLGSTLSAEFVLVAATESAFAAATVALAIALRTPRKKLTVTLGAETLWEWDPSIPTGYNHAPQLEKPGHPDFDSGRSAYYRITWQMDETASTYAQAGRVNASVSLSTNPSCRDTIFISGEWRAQAGVGGTATSARSVYNANKVAYFDFVKLKFAPKVYEGPLNEVSVENETDTIVTFSAEFRHLLFDQVSGVRDDPRVQNDNLELALEKSYPGDSPGRVIGRVQYVLVNYSTNVCADTAKGGTQAIVDLYDSFIRPHILATIDAKFSARQRSVVEETARYSFTDNLISAQWRVLLIPGSACLSYERSTNISEDFGWVLVPIWDGEPFTWYIYPSKITRLREITERLRCVGGGSSRGGGGGGAGGFASIGGFELGPVSGAPGVFIHGGGSDEGKLGSTSALEIAGFATSVPTGASAAGGGTVLVGLSTGSSPEWLLLRKPIQRQTPLLIGNPADGVIAVVDTETFSVEQWVKRKGAPTRAVMGTSAAF